jgi:D-arabinono-1,4-lactone oxidase
VHEASISGEDKNSIVEEISTAALLELLNLFPLLTPLFLDISMIVLLSGSGKFGKSFIVMNQGKLAVKDAGYSVEPGLPVDAADTFIKGAEEIIRIAALSEASFSYLTSPMCMRFVKQSEEYLSPEYKSDTCMIDVPLMLGTIGDDQMLDRLQVDLVALGARPHWGKICNLVNGRELIHKMYPKFDAFLDTVAFFNPKGTFNSSFSYRSGISLMEYKRPV